MALTGPLLVVMTVLEAVNASVVKWLLFNYCICLVLFIFVSVIGLPNFLGTGVGEEIFHLPGRKML